MGDPLLLSFGGFASGFGYRLVSVPYLRPRLERERSRDRSCFNLSAQARNRKRLDDASKAYVSKADRTIYAPPHVIAAIEKQLSAGQTPVAGREGR